MNKLNRLMVTLLAMGLFAGTTLSTQADSLNSKDVVVRTTIATPAKAKVSGQPIDAAAYSSKVATPNDTVAASAKVSPAQPINASAYSSKAR